MDTESEEEVRQFEAFVKAKTGVKELIPGGLAEGVDPKKFNQKQVKIGAKVEMEHTRDPRVAEEISRDHLMEDPEYYVKLKKIEKKHE